jgi:acyl-CoA dehydrogenase
MVQKRPQVIDWIMDNARGICREQVKSLVSFKALFDEKTRAFSLPIDRAVAGGFLADRVGYAFAAGYEAALRRLVPDLPDGPIVSLCISEKEGAHPRAIRTRLIKNPSGAFTLTGEKSFITAALEAERLLVAASTGTDDEGKNRIRMALVERNREGVTVTPMPGLPFVPEISHGIVSFTEVPVTDSDILPGDGYADYIKPFRTIEDVHVIGAVMGYLMRVSLLFSWPQQACQELLLLITAVRALAAGDPLSPSTHLALAGLMDYLDRFLVDIEPLWEKTDAETRTRWTRDRYLLGVAEKARQARLSAAWGRYGF